MSDPLHLDATGLVVDAHPDWVDDDDAAEGEPIEGPVAEGDLASIVEPLVEALLAGGVVLLPTDTVYGIAALPGDADAVARLFDLKGRSAQTPVAVLCADPRQAGSLVDPEDEAAIRSCGERWWPGPLTLVSRRRVGVELHLGEPESTVGLRVPDHPLVRAVAERVGPLATTSANRHGRPPAIDVEEALLSLGDGLAVVVDGGTIEGHASTVVDTTQRPWRALRDGPIPADDVIGHSQAHLL